MSFVGYAVALLMFKVFYGQHPALTYGLLSLLYLALINMVAMIIRSFNRLDEMWRRIHTEAMAFSGLATGFTCFSYLFLRDMGMPEFRAEWAFYMMWFYYGIGAILAARKY